MLETRHLITYHYQCSRLGETTPVNNLVSYYTESLDEYPPDAEIPFAHSSYRMSCCNLNRCGIAMTRNDGTQAYAWHLCPALAALRKKMSLSEVDPND